VEEREEERIIKEIFSLKNHPIEIVFQTDEMIYIREIEDTIAWFFKTKPRLLVGDAYRYYCCEEGGNRFYYSVGVKTEEGKEVTVVTGDATDYSGHGSYDKKLADFFITKFLRLHLVDRPLSYLLSKLKYELYKLRGVE